MNGAAEVLPQPRIEISEANHRVTHGASHRHTSSFGCGRGPSAPTAETESPGELSNQEVALQFRLRRTLGVARRARVLQVAIDVGEASAVRLLRLRVEDLAGVTES